MNSIVEIERSIIKTYRRKIWAPFVRAVQEFELIKPNDHIGVCISGGKDSMLMAKCFQELRRHSDFEFEVSYIVMNPGYNKENLDLIMSNLEGLGIPAVVKESNIFSVAEAQDKNPCYLCAKMRRGCLYRLASELGCNKIALGHHYDDVIETTLMNMLNSGSIQTMLPKLHSENWEGMELIRPMYFIREKDIKLWASYNDLKFIACACKLTKGIAENIETNGGSQRYATKMLIKSLAEYNVNVEKNIFKSMMNVNLNMIVGYKKDGELHSYLEHYDEWKPKEERENKKEESCD